MTTRANTFLLRRPISGVSPEVLIPKRGLSKGEGKRYDFRYKPCPFLVTAGDCSRSDDMAPGNTGAGCAGVADLGLNDHSSTLTSRRSTACLFPPGMRCP